jgi:undecaprenyl-diphosphatase
MALPVWLELWVRVVILGAIEGVSIGVPVSSTAHLSLVVNGLGWKDIPFDLILGLHVGALPVIVYWFRRELREQLNNLWSGLKKIRTGHQQEVFAHASRERIPFYILISLVGLTLSLLLKWIGVEAIFNDARWSSVFVALTGLAVFITAVFSRGQESLSEWTWQKFLVVALIQALAIVPGISRLGVTLCAALLLGLKWHEAVKLVFVYAVPVLAASAIVQLFNQQVWQALTWEGVVYFVSGAVALALTSLIGLNIFTGSLLGRRTLEFFGQYGLMLGGFGLAFFSFWSS